MTVQDIVIPGTPDVTVRGSVAVDGPRFADVAMQVGGFVFDSERRHVTSLRWVPSKGPPYTQIVASSGGDELRCTPSARSQPFIVPHLTGPLSVLLILSHGETERRYDLGDYTLAVPSQPDTLVFHRAVLEPTTTTTTTSADDGPTVDEVVREAQDAPVDVPLSSLEDRYHRVFDLWGIDGLYDILTFHVAEATEPFRPMATLFAVLGDVLLAWCGGSNRFGPSVLFAVGYTPPTPSYFTHLRSMARILRFPVLLGHGCPLSCTGHETTTMQQSEQMACVLFRPGDGAAQHVRFVWDASLLRMVIVPSPAHPMAVHIQL